MRQYQPIWEGLKKTGKCRITAPIPLHPRIIKAVQKEKYQDFAFKLELSDATKWAQLEHVITGSVISFVLTVYNGANRSQYDTVNI